MKIAIVVQGRFHAFDLARALLNRGHDVTLFTNYPKWAVKRFGIPQKNVRSYWTHGLTSRALSKIGAKISGFEPERWLHPAFGAWVANELSKEKWDVVHGWSGVSEEFLNRASASLKLMMRGSSHICTQDRILAQEEERTHVKIDRPGPWIIAREQREYQLADRVVVLSSFAYKSFLEEGAPAAKVRCLPLGTNTTMFRPERSVIEARCRRILSGEPLRVLYVGLVAQRKGLLDIATVARTLQSGNFKFRFVGAATADAKNQVAELAQISEVVPKQPHSELPKWYAWGDVFIFPTLEDGYAVVLAQASASGLPVLTTTNSCGPDLVQEGQTGWILPIRSPQSFIDRLQWCDSHRAELCQMVNRTYEDFRPRDWSDVAADFETLCTAEIQAKHGRVVSNGN